MSIGLLIPELENTQLLLVRSNVQPLSSEGNWETSEDRNQVYARTFAEPHAPTRFFPAALKLNREQLIALHTHEALHRSLPPHIREDEDKVSLLTMALTSPTSNFDRVNRIVQNATAPDESQPLPKLHARTTVGAKVENSRPPMKTQLRLDHWTYRDSWLYTSVEKVGAEFSPIGQYNVGAYVVEPRLDVEGLILNSGYSTYAGPLSFTLNLPVEIEAGKTATPFARFSLRGLEESADPYREQKRDVYTAGARLDLLRPSHYSGYSLSYTAPGDVSSNTRYGGLWSFDMRAGKKLRRFDLGGTLGLYHMMSKGSEESFSILQAGPEIKYKISSVTLRLAGTVVLNRRYNRTLNDLGDLAGHGAGWAGLNLGIGFDL